LPASSTERSRRWLVVAAIVGLLIAAAVWHRAGHEPHGSTAPARDPNSGSITRTPHPGAAIRRFAFDARARLTGRVELRDGTAVPGAEVVIQGGPVADRRHATADGDGTFAFDDLPIGRYLLAATHGDDVAPTLAVDLVPPTTRVTLIVVPGAAIEVTVTSADDRAPIAGATVRITDGDRTFGEQWSERVARTDARGIATFRGMIATASHLIAASAPGYAETTLAVHDFQFAERTWHAELRLPRGARISGRVLDADGHGLAGATVGWELHGVPRPADTPDLFDPFPFHGHMQAVQTDADGRFDMTVEPGAGCVLAAHPTHELGEQCDVTAAVGSERSGVEIVLRDGGEVSGQVVWSDGTPAAGATVIATKRGWIHQPIQSASYRFEAHTRDDGKFEFRGIKRGELDLTAFTDAASSPLVPVDLTKHAAVSGLRIELSNEGTIRGRVVDDTHAPIAYAVVKYAIDPAMSPPDARGKAGGHGTRAEMMARHPDFALPRSIGATRSDGEGSFELDGLPPGVYTLTASRAEPVDLPTAFTSATEPAVAVGDTVELVMKGLGGIRGQVIDESGRPVTVFRVSLSPSLKHPHRDQFAVGHGVVSADGSFALAAVPAGEYRVRIDGDDVTDQVADNAVAVKTGAVADAGTIRVMRGVRRHGIVLAKDKTPAAGARVTATAALWPEPVIVESGDDGAFELPALPAGTALRVRADKLTAASDWMAVTPDTQDITIVLANEGVGAVSGMLVEAGARLDRRSIVLTHVGEGTPDDPLAAVRNTFTGASGEFRFESVPEGDYSIWVQRVSRSKPAPGTAWWKQDAPVHIAATRETQVVLAVPPLPGAGSDDQPQGGSGQGSGQGSSQGKGSSK
jgi:hypothetical protein